MDEFDSLFANASVVGESDFDVEYLEIQHDFRTITIPKSKTLLGVTSDENVNVLHFVCPRYYGKVDLNNFIFRINYLNANGEGDQYWIDDKEIDGDNLTFSWTVGRHACKYSGTVNFIVCAFVLNNGIITQEYNTAIHKLPVVEGIETTEAIVDEKYDIIADLIERTKTLVDLTELEERITAATEAVEGAGNTINDLAAHNSRNILLDFGSFGKQSTGNMRWVWNDAHTTCTYTYNGEVPSIVPYLYHNTSDLPSELVPGKTYQVRFSSTNSDVYLMIGYYAEGNPNQTIDVDTVYSDKAITIPNDCAGLTIDVHTPPLGTAFTATITVEILNALTNKELEEKIAESREYVCSLELSSSWAGDESPFSQVVTLSNYTVTEYTKVNLTATPETIAAMKTQGVGSIYIVNDNAVLTAYVDGYKPITALTVQASVYETKSA